MSQTIRNISQLSSAFESKYCYYLVDKAGQMVKDKIDEFIREYYREYTGTDMPLLYKRTWAFLNSVVKTEPYKIKNGYAVKIYIDTSYEYYNGWTMEGTAIQANQGWHGWYRAVQVGDATHFWDDTLEEIPNILAKAFSEFMSQKGISFSYK